METALLFKVSLLLFGSTVQTSFCLVSILCLSAICWISTRACFNWSMIDDWFLLALWFAFKEQFCCRWYSAPNLESFFRRRRGALRWWFLAQFEIKGFQSGLHWIPNHFNVCRGAIWTFVASIVMASSPASIVLMTTCQDTELEWMEFVQRQENALFHPLAYPDTLTTTSKIDDVKIITLFLHVQWKTQLTPSRVHNWWTRA